MAPGTLTLPIRKQTTNYADEAIDYSYNTTTAAVSKNTEEDPAVSNTEKSSGEFFTGDMNSRRIYNAFSKSKTDTITIEDNQEEQDKSNLFGSEIFVAPLESITTPSRNVEMEWIDSHSDVLKAYQGQWVVVEGSKLIAHGNDFVAVVTEAKTKGIMIPYAVKVPMDIELPFIG